MININCEKERKHTVYNNGEPYEVSNCGAILFWIEDMVNGTIVSICRVCGQKWKVSAVDGEIELHKLPKSTRFEFDDKLKVEV